MKSSAEQQFLYGHHIMKSGLARITEGTSQYQGVVVFSMSDVPLVCKFDWINNNFFKILLIIYLSQTLLIYNENNGAMHIKLFYNIDC